MAILSDEFYYQSIRIDTINTRVFADLVAKEGDANGRGLLVTLTENGLMKDTTGITLILKWEHTSVGNQGLDNFEAVDLSKGLYKITYPTEMLNRGKVRAFIQIIDSGKLAGTRNIEITVDRGVGDDTAIASSDSFTALAQALIDVNNLESTYAPRLLSAEQQLAETEKVINAEHYVNLSDVLTELAVTNKRTIYIPAGDYILDQTLMINTDNTDIKLSPNAKIISSIQNQSAIVFNGKNCHLYGGGTIEYPSVFNGENVKWQDNDAIVLLKNDGCSVKDLKLINVYKVGIGVRGANDVVISHNKIYANFPEATFDPTMPGHFAVAIDPSVLGKGESIVVTNNIINSAVQGLFVGAYGAGFGYGHVFTDNVFTGCFDHGVYANGGIGTIIATNSFKSCKVPIAALGNKTLITNNTLYTDKTGSLRDITGISLREADGCAITNNIIKGDVSDSSVCIDVTNLTLNPPPNTVISDTIISGNIIDITNGNCIAIRVGNSTQTVSVSRVHVKNNIIKANGIAGNGLIVFASKSDVVGGTYNAINGNTITVINNTTAIQPFKQKAMSIMNNTIILEYNALAAEVITLLNAVDIKDSIISGNILRCASEYGENINLRGYREDSNSGYNLIEANSVYFESVKLTAKTEMFKQLTSVAVNNMINRSVS